MQRTNSVASVHVHTVDRDIFAGKIFRLLLFIASTLMRMHVYIYHY